MAELSKGVIKNLKTYFFSKKTRFLLFTSPGLRSVPWSIFIDCGIVTYLLLLHENVAIATVGVQGGRVAC